MKSVSFNLIAFIFPILAQRFPQPFPQYQNVNTYSNSYTSPVLSSASSSDSKSSPVSIAATKDVDDRIFGFIPWFWIFPHDTDDRSNIGAAALSDQSNSNNPANAPQKKAYQSENNDLSGEQSPIQQDSTQFYQFNSADFNSISPENWYVGEFNNQQQPATEAPESYQQQSEQSNISSFNMPQVNDITSLPNEDEQANWATESPGAFEESLNQDTFNSDTQSGQNDANAEPAKIAIDPPVTFGAPIVGNSDVSEFNELDSNPSFLDGPRNPTPILPLSRKPTKPTREGPDTCNKKRYRFLIGSTYSKEVESFNLSQVQLGKSNLPKGTRVIGPNTPVTKDLRPSRLNVVYEQDPITKENKVTNLKCF